MQEEEINRVLWLMTVIASLSLAVIAFLAPHPPRVVDFGWLTAAVVIVDGWLVPFVFLRGPETAGKRIVASGANLLFAFVWVGMTGSTASPFFPHVFFLPVIAAALYTGMLVDVVLTGTAALALSLGLCFAGRPAADGGIFPIASQLVVLLLTSLVVGCLIQAERRQRLEKERMAEAPQAAYGEMQAAHSALQEYTQKVEELNQELEHLAITDDLTSLFNYRYFQARLDQELQHRRAPLALLMIDVDYFKQVNDSFGHEEGNRVLVEIAGLLQEMVREDDIVVRYGGEEFAVILPHTDARHAWQVAERLRQAIAEHDFVFAGGQKLQLTVSIGISAYPDDAREKDDLIGHADAALYQAKQVGRNQIFCYRAGSAAAEAAPAPEES